MNAVSPRATAGAPNLSLDRRAWWPNMQLRIRRDSDDLGDWSLIINLRPLE